MRCGQGQSKYISEVDLQNKRLESSLLIEQARADVWYRRPEIVAPTGIVLGMIIAGLL